MTIEIRPAVASDAAQIHAFITELAVYERAAHEVIANADDVERTLFAADAPAKALMCLLDGKPIGYAVYFYSYSTWLGKNGIYLEDLYITPEQRGIGAGRDLLRHLAQEAVANGCGRLEWSVLDWNTPAIDFYKSIGALPQDEWVRYRMAGDALLNFAQGRR
ncbi:GNAT family N-acetyltransferase [Achromobacter sp. SD115]|uniref:Acetyltransferase, GNAT family protein 18 n=1 Tax=Achromobacter xylosoxidans (strain A8) TaxID=762376 RepID=E3HSJ5_ACHXA|nr:GNAT family N-acetyltransferase [Achromobacter xylosoxidans]ADP17312.1 acetyltransferase, GNAT family protein 18 [Achromobacter xylosoxidans A8]MBO1012232.1 GNAT family N-acetyltransferase [Achromobacter sp. SD115]